MSTGDRDSSFTSPVGKGKGLGDGYHFSTPKVNNTHIPVTVDRYTTDS